MTTTYFYKPYFSQNESCGSKGKSKKPHHFTSKNSGNCNIVMVLEILSVDKFLCTVKKKIQIPGFLERHKSNSIKKVLTVKYSSRTCNERAFSRAICLKFSNVNQMHKDVLKQQHEKRFVCFL